MLYRIFLVFILCLVYFIANLYWHKKIIDGKWIYTIYSSIILVTCTLFVLTVQ